MTTKGMALFALLIVFCISVNRVTAQPQSPTASQKRILVYEGDMAALLGSLAEMHKVTIGFETIPLRPRPGIKVGKVEFATIDEVLNAIIAANPEYQWRASEGFIDVYPRGGSSTLLNTEIHQFQVNNTDWYLASQILLSLPEVQNQMSVLHFSRQELPADSRGSTVNVLSAHLKDMTFRRALHEITKAANRNFWIFERPQRDVFRIN